AVDPVDHAFHLGEHLAGDHDDVARPQPRRGLRDGAGQIVAGPELRQAGHRQDLHLVGRVVAGVLTGGFPDVPAHGRTPARSNAARTMAAVASGPDMISGTSRTSTPGTSARSPSAMSHPSSSPSAASSLRAP